MWSWLLSTAAHTSAPVFFVYCLSVSHKFRRTGSWTAEEAHRYPLACALSVLAVNLGGSILIQAGLKGEGVKEVLKEDWKVATVLLCWFLVYFSPADIVYRVLEKSTPIKFLVDLLNGWKRARDICSGVYLAQMLVPGSVATSIAFGYFSGWGGSTLFPWEARLRGKTTIRVDMYEPTRAYKAVWGCTLLLALWTGPLGVQSPITTKLVPALRKYLPAVAPVEVLLSMDWTLSMFVAYNIVMVWTLWVSLEPYFTSSHITPTSSTTPSTTTTAKSGRARKLSNSTLATPTSSRPTSPASGRRTRTTRTSAAKKTTKNN